MFSFPNAYTTSIPYFATSALEKKDCASDFFLVNEDLDDASSSIEQSKAELSTSLLRFKEEADSIRRELAGKNLVKLNTQFIELKKRVDDFINSQCEILASQAILNAQAAAILKQIAKVMAYPVVSAVYGQNLGCVGDYVTMEWINSSRTYNIKANSDACAAKLASMARTSTRTKQCFRLWTVYRGDVTAYSSYSNMERQEI